MERIYSCVGFEQITDIAAATGLTAANIPPVKGEVVYASIQVTGGTCRFRLDGEDPEATVGQYLGENDSIEVWGQPDLLRFRAIQVTATAVLEVHYFGSGGG